jgi:XTP/dITP diphosphohydrolase
VTHLPKLVVATSNAGKLREFKALLHGIVGEIIPQTALGVVSVAETESTFVGNALLKARHAAKMTGLPALADDSGLEVDALGGAPGVFSARYAGDDADDLANNAKLLDALRHIPVPRTARYRAALVLVRSAHDTQPLVAQGEWEGEIALVPSGDGGFGYDPLFIVAGGSMTAAQLSADEKNDCSHRAKALRRLLQLLRQG